MKENSKTIVVDVSSHGLGHLGQVAPVVADLKAKYPTTRVVIRSAYAASVVRGMIGSDVELCEPPPEATPIMRDPTTVVAEASVKAFQEFHAAWDDHLDHETARLATLSPSALVADVPYLSLAAAKRLGIPAIALGSLNWLDIYRAYCAHGQGSDAIAHTIEESYRSADLFLQPCPHMPMSELPNRRSIGPIARMGRRRKEKIREILGVSRADHVVLATFGGIPSEGRIRLPNISGVHWLVGTRHSEALANVTDVSRLDISFIDVLASSDAVVTKVGYSTFVEAACHGVGIVCAPRVDWPESDPLIEWAKNNANFALAEEGLENSLGLAASLSQVLNAPRKIPVAASGVAEAVEIISRIAKLGP